MLVEPSRSLGPHKVPTELSQSESDVKGSPCMRCAPHQSADLTATSLNAHLWIEAFRHARVVGRRDGKEERCHSSLRNNPRGERDARAPRDVDRAESTASQSASPRVRVLVDPWLKLRRRNYSRAAAFAVGLWRHSRKVQGLIPDHFTKKPLLHRNFARLSKMFVKHGWTCFDRHGG
jgi:hypothetical protein